MTGQPLMAQAGDVALITGASSGIGRAIAHQLASMGYRLVLAARRHDRLQSLADQLSRQGVEVMPQTVDLRQEGDILTLFHAVRERWGGVNVLINNAGLGHKAPLMSGATDLWRDMLDVNVLALSICTREAIQDMQRQGDRGHIIHISSLSGHRVPTGSGMYAASKFAVHALTEALRLELRQANSRIRISAISPGYVETEFAAKYHRSPERAEEVYGQFTVLQPEDVARSVAYVLSQPEHVQVHDLLIRPTEQFS